MPDYFKSPVAIPATAAGMPAAALCPGDLPLVLLPVRLETRFFTLADRSTELRVRVFPDKIPPGQTKPATIGRGVSTTGSRTGAPATSGPRVKPRLLRSGASWRIVSVPAARRGSRGFCSRRIRQSGRMHPPRRVRR